MCGVNVGFMPVGNQLGSTLANAGNLRWLLIPVGMLVGYFIVAAEPAVHVLKDQVEEVSKGAISKRSMGISLSVGVAASVGISMLRILTGFRCYGSYPGYVIALGMSFFVSQMFTAVACRRRRSRFRTDDGDVPYAACARSVYRARRKHYVRRVRNSRDGRDDAASYDSDSRILFDSEKENRAQTDSDFDGARTRSSGVFRLGGRYG